MKKKIVKLKAYIEKSNDMEPAGMPIGSKEVPFVTFSLTRKEQRLIANKECKLTIEVIG